MCLGLCDTAYRQQTCRQFSLDFVLWVGGWVGVMWGVGVCVCVCVCVCCVHACVCACVLPLCVVEMEQEIVFLQS